MAAQDFSALDARLRSDLGLPGAGELFPRGVDTDPMPYEQDSWANALEVDDVLSSESSAGDNELH